MRGRKRLTSTDASIYLLPAAPVQGDLAAAGAAADGVSSPETLQEWLLRMQPLRRGATVYARSDKVAAINGYTAPLEAGFGSHGACLLSEAT